MAYRYTVQQLLDNETGLGAHYLPPFEVERDRSGGFWVRRLTLLRGTPRTNFFHGNHEYAVKVVSFEEDLLPGATRTGIGIIIADTPLELFKSFGNVTGWHLEHFVQVRKLD